jgi:glycosyltransferase involved in cell wall biosynthesis
MKILLVNDYGTATGGAELQMLSLRQGLRDRGHDVRLFSSRASLVPSPLLANYHCYGSTQKMQVLSQTLNPSAYLNLRSALQSFQPDVVHVRMFMWQLSPMILPLLRQVPCLYQTAVYKAICPLGTKVLPDGRSCSSAVGTACLQSCLTPQTWLPMMVQHHLWQRWRSAFDTVVALSHTMKNQLEAAGITPVEVIHNGVAQCPPRPPLGQVPTIAFAGRLVPEKGVDVVMRAIARLRSDIPEMRFMIAGQGTEAERLQQLARELQIEDCVTWLGHLPRQEMEQQFASAWVQVVPSLWEEPFGNVTTEAMMRGTAVIASRMGAQPEIVAEGTTGFLVSPGNVSEWTERLRQLLQNPSLAEAMGQAGRQRALAHFSEDHRTDRFIELYHRISAAYLQADSQVWI